MNRNLPYFQVDVDAAITDGYYGHCSMCGKRYVSNKKHGIRVLCEYCYSIAESSGIEHIPQKYLYSSLARYKDWLGREVGYREPKGYE